MLIPSARPLSLCLLLAQLAAAYPADAVTGPEIPFAPNTYQCMRAYAAPQIDGLAEDPAWDNAGWTEWFVDITGNEELTPGLETQAKLMWDSENLYVLARMEDPDLYSSGEMLAFPDGGDNLFAVYIDSDSDNCNYPVIQVNPYGAFKQENYNLPPRDGGAAQPGPDTGWVQVAVLLDGTLNDPSDTDEAWNVEMAIPWKALGMDEAPTTGDRWRVNLARTHVYVTDMGGHYERNSSETGGLLEPDTWCWSPQGAASMHLPEMWGILQFEGGIAVPSRPSLLPIDYARQALMCMYYWQHDYREQHGEFALSKVPYWYEDYPLPDVDLFREWLLQDEVHASADQFRFSISDGKRSLTVDELGRLAISEFPLEPVEEPAEEDPPVGPQQSGNATEHAYPPVRSSTEGRNTPPDD